MPPDENPLAPLQTRPVAEGIEPSSGVRLWIGLAALPILLVAIIVVPPPDGLSVGGWRAAGVGLLMGMLWITEALPLAATALLPLVLFPLLGVTSGRTAMMDAAAPYADPVIFLFMGGFMLSLAMQRWNLHKRIALSIISHVGSRPRAIIGGFLVATAFISMWVSNAATAMMMLPIGLSVTALMEETMGRETARTFCLSLMLAIGFASTIGGLGTPVGTPPNGILVGYMKNQHGIDISFLNFMSVGIPLMAVSLPVTHLLLTRWCFRVSNDTVPGAHERIADDLRKLGPMGFGERAVAVVFGLAAVLWIGRPWIVDWMPHAGNLKAMSSGMDTVIAMLAGLALFVIPVDLRRGIFVLDWKQAAKLPWDVLVLFGGGLSLAAAFDRTKFAGWLGEQATALGILPFWGIVLVVALAVIFLSELASNTAIAAAFVPVAASLAVGLHQDPLLLTVPTTLAASCAFMLPVGTPPSAIIFGSGYLTLPQMARVGIWLNLLFAGLITVFAMTVIRWAFAV